MQSVTGAIRVGGYVKFLVAGTCYGISFYMTPNALRNNWGMFGLNGQTTHQQFVGFYGFELETVAKWTSGFFRKPVKISANQTYAMFVEIHNSMPYGLMVTAHSPDSDITRGNFLIPASVTGVPNGGTQTSQQISLPTSIGNAKPAIDVLFRQS